MSVTAISLMIVAAVVVICTLSAFAARTLGFSRRLAFCCVFVLGAPPLVLVLLVNVWGLFGQFGLPSLGFF